MGGWGREKRRQSFAHRDPDTVQEHHLTLPPQSYRILNLITQLPFPFRERRALLADTSWKETLLDTGYLPPENPGTETMAESIPLLPGLSGSIGLIRLQEHVGRSTWEAY